MDEEESGEKIERRGRGANPVLVAKAPWKNLILRIKAHALRCYPSITFHTIPSWESGTNHPMGRGRKKKKGKKNGKNNGG